MVDLMSQYQKIKPAIDTAILNVIENAKYINGPEVTNFQSELENYLNVKHVIPCANGTDALQIALMALNLKPIGDRIVVEAAPAEEKTASGIYIPDTAKEKPQRGTVIAAGPGKKDEPVTVKTGDTVLYGKYAGTEINIDGNDYLIMRESDIFAVL